MPPKPFSFAAAAKKNAQPSTPINNNTDFPSPTPLTTKKPTAASIVAGTASTSTSNSNSSSVSARPSSAKKPTLHPLKCGWVVWYMHRAPGAKIDDYEKALKRVAGFKTVEDFLSTYCWLARPNDLETISDYHLFKEGLRPTWEDSPVGGKWIIRLKKGLASRYWESLVFALIGDQFDVPNSEICGAVISIRNSEDILSVWNQTADDASTNLKIRDTLKRVLGLPENCIMEYKAHRQALQDHSSFRNTDMFR